VTDDDPNHLIEMGQPGLVGDLYRDDVVFGAASRLTAATFYRMLAMVSGESLTELAAGRSIGPDDPETAEALAGDDGDLRLRLLGMLQATLDIHRMHEQNSVDAYDAYAYGYTSVVGNGGMHDHTPALVALLTESIQQISRLVAGQVASDRVFEGNDRDIAGWLVGGLTTVAKLYGAIMMGRTFTELGHNALDSWLDSARDLVDKPCLFPHLWGGADVCPCGDHGVDGTS
jgi:hypothetical protein